ncbi:zn 2cys6 transcription factor protein [Diplodia corticola]|uniref:Zn 2cys6 transcription factor protein n=1 Tax=Diplodia corticola TaxID=236234 RepID=A0A1J9RLK6_9PEZI|nr:zn 2cys6 transcription factor protein [Diplodia corticola]OJD33459.1 zn 2cys6 transcription factor protein [Diplodia corticola]
MVGVPKSKGCATCRSRKIRVSLSSLAAKPAACVLIPRAREQCDETWPVCQQCRRSRRECPGPSNPHGKFMDEGPRQRARGNTAVPNDPARAPPPFRPLPQEESHVQPTPCTDIETVRTKLTTSGAMFTTMKIVSDEPHNALAARFPPAKHHSTSPPDARGARKQLQRQKAVFGRLPQTLPLSGVDMLTFRLVATLNEAGPSNQIKLFGPFIGEVPRRLGSTTALNDAAACLTTTHDAIIRKHSKTSINPQLYAKALKSLYAAIQDPVQVKSTSTLCATVLLAITEAYATGICGTNRNFITHLGGAARILELRGPKEFQNPSSFERALLRAVTVGVGLDAMFTGKEDILATREWQAVAFDTTGVAEPRASMFRISRTLSLLPSLTRDVRAFLACPSGPSASSSSSTVRLSLLRRAESLHKMLDRVKPYIDATLADPQRVRRVAAAPEHAHLWPEAYRFADPGVAFVLWFFWNMRMITSSIIIGLHRHRHGHGQSPSPSPTAAASSPTATTTTTSPPHSSSSSSSSQPPCSSSSSSNHRRVAALERDIHAMARAVCMSWEHARAVRPLGAMYIDVGLIVAHSVYSASPARRRWVRAALEELTEGSGEDEGSWSAERVGWLARWFTAGCVDYVGGGGGEGEGEGEDGCGGWGGGDGGWEVGGAVELAMEEVVVVEEGEEQQQQQHRLLLRRETTASTTTTTSSESSSSSSWDEWAFTAAAGDQDFVDWDVGGVTSAADDMSFGAADSTRAEPIASASTTDTVTGAAGTAAAVGGGGGGSGAWSPDSLASSLADTDSFLVLQPMGVRVRWPTTTTTMNNNGRAYGFDRFNAFGSAPLNSRSFVA